LPARRRLRVVVAAVSLLAIASLCLGWTTNAQAQARTFHEEKAFWEDHFATVPDVSVKGSGWKPFNRWLWFTERRIDPQTGEVPAGARWQAYLQQQEMLDREGPRDTPVWTSLGPVNIAGRCQPIAIDPANHDRILVGSASGGLWESTNAGASWEPVDDQLPTLAIGAILFDENDPSVVYMGTGEGNNNADAVFGVGVMVSTDGGLTWDILGSGLEWSIGDGKAVNALAMNPGSGAILAATTDGTWRYAGGTWTQVLTGTATSIVRHPTTTTTFYVANGRSGGSALNGVYISTDDGLTWTEQTNGFPSTHGRVGLAIAESAPSTLYAGISAGSGVMLGIYKTTDGGTTWALAFNADNHYAQQGWYDLIIGVDPTNPNKVYSGGLDLYRSTNGGTSFVQLSAWDLPPGNPSYVHADQHGWAFHPDDPNHVYAACDGGVFESFNSGDDWTEISTGLTTMQFYDIDVSQSNPDVAMGGTQDNGTNVYSGSTTWTRSLGGDGFHCNIDYAKPDTMYMELYYGTHYRSYTGGGNRTGINGGLGEQGAWDTPVHLDYGNTAILYTGHGKIYKTTNRGGAWTAKTAVLPGKGVSITQCPGDLNHLYCAFSAVRAIHHSTDRGETWTQVTATGIPNRGITRVKTHPTDPSIVFVTTSGFATPNVWKSTDSGATFTGIAGNMPALPCNAIEIDPEDADIIYVGTDLGVWRTENGGTIWLPYGTGLPNTVVGDLRIMQESRLLRCGTYGRGLWEVPMQEAGTSAVQESGVASTRISIVDVSPNPLPGGPASVRFALPREARVRVQLFDVSGRLIETPLDEDLKGGVHRVEWPTRAQSGVYFVKVRQGHEVASAKLTVQR
jgi:hypothetical protein